LAVDPKNHMRELGHYRHRVPKIKRHRTLWNWAIAADWAWQCRGNERGRLLLECPRAIDTVQIDDHPHSYNEDETAYGDSVFPRYLVMACYDVDHDGTRHAQTDGRKDNTPGPECKHRQRQ